MSDGDDGDFGRFLKPGLRRRLGALGMDVAYHRGRGDHLYFREGGQEVEVLDLVGGFGANLFGHNHPAIVAAWRRVLDRGSPFLAQASVRSEAGRLARRLSDRVGRSTGRSYVVTLANSGAEAVEAALKHAELDRRERIAGRVRRTRRTFAELQERLGNGTARLPEGFLAEAGSELRGGPFEDLDGLSAWLEARLEGLADRRPVALALEGGFHGKTVATTQLTHNPLFRSRWSHLGPDVCFLRPGSSEDLRAALEEARVSWADLEIQDDGRPALREASFVNVVACFAEPVQGEGGVRPLAASYLGELRAAADGGEFPLVFDEIQSGMGRTGTFLASEATGVRADYYTLAKSLGGGLAKISALLVDRDRYVEELDVVHTSTYANDDHASAAANAALDLLERDGEGLLSACREKGDYLMERLRELRAAYPDHLREVRGRGLMVGVELGSQAESSSPLLRVISAQDRLGEVVSGHLLAEERIRVFPTLSSGATLRLEPSAFVERAELDRFCRALEGVLRALRDGDAHRLVRHVVDGGAAPLDRRDPTPRAQAPGAGLGQGTTPRGPGRVGFLGHFVEPGDLKVWDPALSPFSDDACGRFLERTRGAVAPFVAAEGVIRSTTGASVTATMIALPFTAAQARDAMRAGQDAWLLSWIDDAIRLARDLDCSVLGFGGYTSIATRGCRTVHAPGLAVTTGNALTAAAALEATFRAADRLQIDGRILGVVGALGNIGRVLAEVAAPDVDEVVLVGRSEARERLGELAGSLDARGRVRVAEDLEELRRCDLIISATNSARPVILPEHVDPGRPVVITDVALPGDVDPRVSRERPSVAVLQGGIIRPPLGQDLDLGGVGLGPGRLYGCLAEALILGLEGSRESLSRGRLRADRVRRARDLARRHGFSIYEPLAP